MPVWLVTGGSGFLGRHLLARLQAELPTGVSLLAIGRRCPVGWSDQKFLKLDLTNFTALFQVIESFRPSLVFHMAGKTPPGRADEFDLMNTDVTSRFIQALEASKVRCRVIVAGSAAELGPVPLEDLPVAEGYPCQPVEPYGLSKWRATQVALAALSPVEVAIGRVFNPIGPGLPGSQAFGRFALILANGEGPIQLTVGDLDARRDFIDVRDVADAFMALAHHGRAGQIYHLGTGQSHSIREGLARLIGLSGREVSIVVDPEFAHSRGPSDSRADIRKIGEHVGWSPRISWDQSLADLWQAAKGKWPD